MSAVLKEIEAKPGELKDSWIPGPAKFKLRESVNNAYTVILSAEVTVDQLSDPKLWTRVPNTLLAFDTIIAIGNGFWAELLVREHVVHGGSTILLLRSVTLPDLNPDLSEQIPLNHSVTQDPQTGEWIATRLHDGVVMGRGREQRWTCKADVVMFLRNHASMRDEQR